jgi:hypothetical protein
MGAAIVHLLLLASVALVIRMIMALVSRASARQLRKHWKVHVLWFLAIPAVCLIFWPYIGNAWPPLWWERQALLNEMQAKVQSAGGWEALKKDCLAFSEQHKDESGSSWHRNDTNGLPASIVALQPQRVEFYLPDVGKNFNDSGMPIVRITVFGANATGGRGTPWIGMDVLCGNPTKDYLPKRNRSSDRDWRYRKVTEGVYEFY